MIPFSISFENGSKAQQIQINNALVDAHYAMETQEFKDRILNHVMPDLNDLEGKWKNGKWIGKWVKGFYQTDLSNEEVYDLIMSSPWNYSVSFYSKKFSSARAYVNPGDPTVNLNWAKIAGEESAITGNTLTHENTHLKGFKHDYQSTFMRPFSLPYGWGKAVQETIEGKSPEEQPEPKIYVMPWYKKMLPWNWF